MSTIAELIRQFQTQGAGGDSFFPDLGGPNEDGFRDLASRFLGRDVSEQQRVFDEAAARQRAFAGEAAEALRGGAAGIREAGVSGLEEIRGLTQDAQADFDQESTRIRAESRERFLGDTASQVAGASGSLASRISDIENDPMLTPAQKMQLKGEAQNQVGQQTTANISAQIQGFQNRELQTDLNLLSTEVGMRQSNIGQIQQAYDRLGKAELSAAQLESQGFAQLAALEGQADGVASLFGSLAQLAAFEQSTRLPITMDFGMDGGTFVPSFTGNQFIPTYSFTQTPGTGPGGY